MKNIHITSSVIPARRVIASVAKQSHSIAILTKRCHSVGNCVAIGTILFLLTINHTFAQLQFYSSNQKYIRLETTQEVQNGNLHIEIYAKSIGNPPPSALLPGEWNLPFIVDTTSLDLPNAQLLLSGCGIWHQNHCYTQMAFEKMEYDRNEMSLHIIPKINRPGTPPSFNPNQQLIATIIIPILNPNGTSGLQWKTDIGAQVSWSGHYLTPHIETDQPNPNFHLNQPAHKTSTSSVIANEVKQSQIQIYPNPSTSHFNITAPEKTQRLDIQVTSLAGTTVYKNTISGNKTTLDLSKLPAGSYNLTINNTSQQIVIQR